MGTQTQNESYMPKQNDRPVHEVRIGSCKAAVWKNETSNGIRYNVTFSRIYKDKDDDQWKSTSSFGGQADLLALAKVADVTHSWICEQNQDKDAEPQD
ncbi:MAG: hypothetical protein C5B50_05410 [Verrucomicrobia bacterium]|nr:MAG: hypothetical protein C5B50_05410 [Verrucomicrobiota bacterium]